MMINKRNKILIMKFFFIFIVSLNSYVSVFAIEPLNDTDLDDITAQDGINIVLDNFKITFPGGTFAIGGHDGLGIPAAPDGAWFIFDFDRTVQLDVEKGEFGIDVFTSSPTANTTLGDNYLFPKNHTAALIDFGEAYFHINNTEALYTLKFGNNPQGNEGNGVTEFADTVCNFAFNGSTITFKSDDAKMYIFSH